MEKLRDRVEDILREDMGVSHTVAAIMQAVEEDRSMVDSALVQHANRIEELEARKAKLVEALDRMVMTVVRGHAPMDVQQQCIRIKKAALAVKEKK